MQSKFYISNFARFDGQYHQIVNEDRGPLSKVLRSYVQLPPAVKVAPSCLGVEGLGCAPGLHVAHLSDMIEHDAVQCMLLPALSSSSARGRCPAHLFKCSCMLWIWVSCQNCQTAPLPAGWSIHASMRPYYIVKITKVWLQYRQIMFSIGHDHDIYVLHWTWYFYTGESTNTNTHPSSRSEPTFSFCIVSR